jgi:hypothetical protein
MEQHHVATIDQVEHVQFAFGQIHQSHLVIVNVLD